MRYNIVCFFSLLLVLPWCLPRHYQGKLVMVTNRSSSIMDKYNLPPFQLMAKQESEQLIDVLQVVRRFHAVNLTEQYVMNADRWKQLKNEAEAVIESFKMQGVKFEGSDGTALNNFLRNNTGKKVIITKDVNVSEPISIPQNTFLDGAGYTLIAHTDRVIRMASVQHAAVSNLKITGSFKIGIYITHGANLLIEEVVITKGSDRPVVIMGNTKNINLLNNIIEDNERGGIYVRGPVAGGLISGNKIRNNRHANNQSAGIVLTHFQVQDAENPEKASFSSIDQSLEYPHDILILNNEISGQQSSGIYLDGAVSIYLRENKIIENDKEGICFDFGTTGCHFFNNTVMRNGKRGKQSDNDLIMDFVLVHGRMEDGSAKSKLPGISIDNALYNVIIDNTIEGNYGSGVKMVRTGVRNIIGQNRILNNNAGHSDKFHFFGIELGFAVLDEEADFLDATPDYENIIFENKVSGPHYAGIFLAEEVYKNQIIRNTIEGSEQFGIESISQKDNLLSENKADKPARGLSNNHQH